MLRKAVPPHVAFSVVLLVLVRAPPLPLPGSGDHTVTSACQARQRRGLAVAVRRPPSESLKAWPRMSRLGQSPAPASSGGSGNPMHAATHY